MTPITEWMLPDENFRDSVNTQIHPYINPMCQEWTIDGYNGMPIRSKFYFNPGSTRVVCICHGFTEFIERYEEIIYIFLKNGFSVAICDHRGHGRSHRMTENLSMVHIDSYMTYVRDYHYFVEKVRENFPDHQMILFGHSMGGCISTLYLKTYPKDFDLCVLSSPMMEVSSGPIPLPIASLYGNLATLIGHGEKYLGSQNQNFDGSEKFEDSCCLNRERFDYWYSLRLEDPFFQTCAGSIGWMTASVKAARQARNAAKKIHTPILLIQAGKDNMVLPGGQDQFVMNCSSAHILRVPGAKHEIFNCNHEMRERFWTKILEFLEEHRP